MGTEERRSGKKEAGGTRSDACYFLIVTVNIAEINTGMMIALTDQAPSLDVLQCNELNREPKKNRQFEI